MRFDEFELNEKLLKGISEAGFENCMPVQEQTFEHSLKGVDLIVQSQTGTGKTAAFLISLFQRFTSDDMLPGSKALIIAPTRELVVQIEKEAKLLGKNLKYNTHCFYGGVGYATQEKALKKGVDIYVATPGRLIDLNEKGMIDFRQIDILVIDEADRMFDMGFLPDIRRILRKMKPPGKRQAMLFSATIDDNTSYIAGEFMVDPGMVRIAPEKMTVDKIKQELYHVGRKEKMNLMLGLLKHHIPKNALVFTNTKHDAVKVAKRLEYNGFECRSLIGDMPQSKRLKVMEDFKSGKLSFLVATDVAARGLHIDDLEMVFNYDLPGDSENYVHRIGRTARAGKSGIAISLVCENYVYNLDSIEELIGKKIEVQYAEDELYKEDKSTGMELDSINKDAKKLKKSKSAPYKSKSKGRSQMKAGNTQSSEQGRKKTQPKKPRRKPVVKPDGVVAKKRNSESIDDRLAYYRKKYGEDFKVTAGPPGTVGATTVGKSSKDKRTPVTRERKSILKKIAGIFGFGR